MGSYLAELQLEKGYEVHGIIRRASTPEIFFKVRMWRYAASGAMKIIAEPVARALSWKVFARPDKRFVFLYHDVSQPHEFQHSASYSTTVEAFQAQMDFLVRQFQFVTLDEIVSVEAAKSQKPLASLTFDDGFLTVKQNAMPWLRLKNIPFAVFLNRMAIVENRLLNESEDAKLERTGNVKIFLDEDDVKSLSQSGVTIGSHTSTHRKLAECDDETLHEEIDANKDYLEHLIGEPVRYVALPFGKREHYSNRVLEHCLSAGHEFVFSTNPTFFDSSSASYQRRVIPRVSFTGQTIAQVTFMINRPLVKRIDI